MIISITISITGIIVARGIGPEGVGIINYATSFVSMFLFITGLFGSAHIKLVSEGNDEENCLLIYRRLFMLSVIIFTAVVIGAIVIKCIYFGNSSENKNTNLVIIITIVAIITGHIFQFNESIFNARTEQVRAQFPALLKNLSYNAFRILVVILGLGVIGLALSNLLSTLLLIPFALKYIKKMSFGKWDSRLAKRYVTLSIPIFFITLTNSFLTYSDKLVLGYYGTKKEIGYYSAAYSIGATLILVGNTAGTIFFPLFSKLLSENLYDKVYEKIAQFERFIFIFIFPFICCFSIFSYSIIVGLLSAKYVNSVGLFAFLVFDSFFIVWAMPYGNVLTGLGLFWVTVAINVIKLVIFTITLIVCIHPQLMNMGAYSLVVTALVVDVFTFISYYFLSYRKIKRHNAKYWMIQFLYWGMFYGVYHLLFMDFILRNNIFVQLFVYLPLTLGIAFGLQYLLGISNKHDIKQLKEILSPKKNMEYIKNEI
jgi:O-antigen/teichoic acid export membrane protein